MNRRRIALSALAGAGAWLAACTPQGDGAGGAAPGATREPVTLRHATGAPTGGFHAAERQVLERFTQQHPRITVEAEAHSPTATVYEKALAQASAGTAPDVVLAHPRDSRVLLDAGALLELDPYLKRDRKTVPDILPNLWGYFEQEGRQYYLPNNSAPFAMYYNRALFQQRGVKPLDQYEAERRWTVDTLLDVARQLTFGAGETKVWAIDWFWAVLDIHLAFIWPFGGDLWDKTEQSTVLDSKESLEAIQYMADLTARHRVSPTEEERKTPGITFQNGRVAMYVTTNAIVADFANAPFDKGVVPMPTGRAGRVVRNVPFGVHIAKGSKHHDAAWEYAVFQAGAESERIMLGAQVSAPWHKASLSGQEFARTLHPWQSAAAYVETVNKVRPTRYVKRFTDINRIYGPAYARVWAGEKTAPAAIGEIKTQINELLKKP